MASTLRGPVQTTRRTRATPSRDASGLLPPRDHLDRQPARDERVPRRRRAHWTFVSDPERKLQKDFDIAEYTDPHHNPMIPHTLVLEPGLRVYSIYNGYWFFGRPTAEELRLDLRAVLQRRRPDWDIGSTQQRAAYEKGDKAGFFPYGRTQSQVLAEPD